MEPEAAPRRADRGKGGQSTEDGALAPPAGRLTALHRRCLDLVRKVVNPRRREPLSRWARRDDFERRKAPEAVAVDQDKDSRALVLRQSVRADEGVRREDRESLRDDGPDRGHEEGGAGCRSVDWMRRRQARRAPPRASASCRAPWHQRGGPFAVSSRAVDAGRPPALADPHRSHGRVAAFWKRSASRRRALTSAVWKASR
jgi:hypothetical protein